MRYFITVNQYAQGCHEKKFGDTDACIVGQPHGECNLQGGDVGRGSYSIDAETQVPISFSLTRFSSFPVCQLIFGYDFFSTATLLAMVLLPEVAKGITVLPVKSDVSMNEFTVLGARSHQIG